MKDMNGKTCVVTGGTSGIGGAIAKELAARGAHVVLVGRNPDKGAAVAAQLQKETGNQAVEFLQADLSSQKSIRALAGEIEKRYPRVDVLVNNAGGSVWKREVTVDGIERSLAFNLLAPFLLTKLLLPLLERSAPARIVNVATKPRKGDTVDFDDLQQERKYNAFGAYGKAKTGLIMYSYELARRLEGRGVTVNTVHPGIILGTDFGSDMPAPMKVIGPFVARLIGLSVTMEQGIATPVYLATSSEVASVTGKYFHNKQAIPSLPQTYDVAAARRLWDACEALTSGGADGNARAGATSASHLAPALA